jgi:hypothetical protein
MSAVIHTAWKNGAKFDAWQDQFRFDAWTSAFTAEGLEPDFYSHRQRGENEVFPWDHIADAVRKKVMLQEYHRSQKGETLADCRQDCYACGILPTFSADRREHPGNYWKCPEVPRPAREPTQP